jgi:hypothetical protein
VSIEWPQLRRKFQEKNSLQPIDHGKRKLGVTASA